MIFLPIKSSCKDFLTQKKCTKRRQVCWLVVTLVLPTEAKFLPASLLSRLTEKHRQAIVAAREHGYFETSRRTSSEQFAKKLDLVKSTLMIHLRRAEKRLLAEMLNE